MRTLISPMAADWIALDALYPLRTAFAGNTTWGFHTNITSTVFADLGTYAASSAFTVVDRGGIDTVDFSGFAADQTIRPDRGDLFRHRRAAPAT